MNAKILFSLCCMIAVYSLLSCTKDEFHGPPGLPGDTGVYIPLKGDISGTVAVYDSLGRALADYSGAQVIIDSTDLSTITDASGAYFFHDVPAGRYNFSFKKEGYGTYRIIRQLHPGGPQTTHLVNADVGKIYDGPPVTLFLIMDLGSPTNPQIITYTEFASPIRVPAASVLYFSNKPDISSTNFRINLRYANAFVGNGNMNYQTSPFGHDVIESDTALNHSRSLYMFLAFDNVRDIHYIDEEGRVIYPCTGRKFESPPLSGPAARHIPSNIRNAHDGVYPLLQRFRLK